MKRIKKLFRTIFYRFFPIIKNTVFFESFCGQYNDNPKYVSEELHRVAPNINIVWAVSSRGHELPPDYAKTVEFGSKEYYKYAYRSQVVVENHMGIIAFGFLPFKIPFLDFLLNRKEQLCVATWHGTPLKKIGKDTVKRKNSHYCSTTDYCVAGCDFTADNFEKTFYLKDKIKMYGTPRNDLLVNNSCDIVQLKKKLNLPSDKKIILFAPTFRDDFKMSGLYQMNTLDINAILKSLEEKFSGEFVFVFRVHHTVVERMDNSLFEKYGDRIVNGNVGDDMAEYLLCADVLLTDYSSSFFDYALMEKPVFLYMPDKEHYGNVERGFYIELKELPFSQAETEVELLENIRNFSDQSYRDNVKMFLDKLGNHEDGKASSRIVNDIIFHINKFKCDKK